MSLIENLLRQNLEPLNARAFVRLRDVYGLSLSQIAGRVHKSKMYLSNRVRLVSDRTPSLVNAGTPHPDSNRHSLRVGGTPRSLRA